MNAKLSLALIALVGVGVFALPSTMALFSGQHSFYNIDATGNQIPCTKCHGDVKAELNSGYSATTGTPGPHAKFQCEYCHRAENGFASGDDAYAKVRYYDAAGHELDLVTTIANYERGNFPKQIDWAAAANTVDNWVAWQNKTAGKSFVNQTDYQDVNGKYAGSLSAPTTAAAGEYDYDMTWEIATEANGVPKDLTATATTAFNPRAVTWNGLIESLQGAGSREITPGTRYHAASLVSCLECHGGEQSKGVAGYEVDTTTPYNHAQWVLEDPTKCSNCHYGIAPVDTTTVADQLMAGGFGLTSSPNDTGEVEAHKPFVTTNDGVDRFGYGASNGACIACHTHVAVDINFKKGYKLSFDATESKTGQYSVGNFAVEGTVAVSIYGNGSGQTFATGNSTYTWTPTQNLYINGNRATKVVGLGNGGTSTNDSAEALSSGK